MNLGRANLLGMLLLGTVLSAAMPPMTAGAAPLTGAWRQTLLSQTYRLSPSWSTDFCPPRPPDRQVARPREYQVSESGDGYTFRSGRESFGSRDCLSENPAVKPTGYDPASRTTHCATPEAAGTHEIDSHRLVLQGDNALEVRGEYHYFWVLKGNTCEAWMNELRRFERSAAEAAAPAATQAAATPPPGAAVPVPPPVQPPMSPPATEPGAATGQPAAAPAAGHEAGVAPPLRWPPRGGQNRQLSPIELELARRADRQQAGGGAFARRSLSGITESLADMWLLYLLGGVAALGLTAMVILVLRQRRNKAAPQDAASDIPSPDLVFYKPDEGVTRPKPPPAALTAKAPPGESPGTPEPVELRRTAHGAGAVPTRVTCPHCGARLPPDAAFCPFDATPLQGPGAAAAAAQGPAGGAVGLPLERFCPQCLARYDATRDCCSADGTALLPLFAESIASMPTVQVEEYKICPACETRYAPEVSFCGKDGTPLVLKHG